MFFKSFINKKRIYLDYASSTPRDSKMVSSFAAQNTNSANPGSLHKSGVSSKKLVELLRKSLAEKINAHSDEIIFTSGATESNNLALQGLFNAFFFKYRILPQDMLFYTTDLEHASVKEVVNYLHHRGVHYSTLESTEGIVNPKDIVVPVDIKVCVVSTIFVQNEIGTVNNIKEIAKRIRFLKKEHPNVHFVFHTDATQAPLFFHLGVPQLGIDLMSIGSTKLYCNRGSGFLYKRRGIELTPLMYGGGQEFGLRPGTESVALISEFVQAFLYAQNNFEKTYQHNLNLKNYFEIALKVHVPQAYITAEYTERSPHITHITIPDFDSELLVLELDARGVEVSARSACKNETDQHTDLPLNLATDSDGTIRFSFGRMTTKKDLDYAIQALADVLKKYKKV